MDISLTADSMKVMDPEKLNELLVREYIRPIPIDINSIDDMANAGHLMGILTNSYSYMITVLNTFKIWTKIAKSSGDKKEYELMAMRRDTVEAITDILKQQYNAISRLITIKQEMNNELRMTDGKR